jgi:hypothetical protein
MPTNRGDLEQYLRVVDDFFRRNQFETMSLLILRRLAKGGIMWSWNADVKKQLLIILNVVGIYFLRPK